MATLALGAVGGGIGAAFGGLAGAELGFSIGVTLAGVLFPPKQGIQEKGKLDDLRITGSGYGTLIPQIYGKGLVGGNVIWSTDLIEHSSKKSSGAKGVPRVTSKTYTYTVDMWVALCEGPIGGVRRIWADDRLIYDGTTGLTSEIQQITVGTNTAGYFTVTFRGATTAAIAWDAATATVLAELEGLSSIGVGNITVSGPDGGPWLANFDGELAGQNLPRMDMSNGTLTGGSGEGITTVQQGSKQIDITVFYGTEDQEPWSVAETALGVGNVPAYRGIAGLGFENLDLTPYGGRVPVIRAEVAPRPWVSTDDMLWDFNATDINGLSNGDDVTTWEDSSGNDNDAVVDPFTAAPTYLASGISGKPAVDNASGQGMRITFGTIDPVVTSDDLTLYLVCDYTSPQAGNAIALQVYEDPEITLGMDLPTDFYGVGDPPVTSVGVETTDDTGFNPEHTLTAAVSGAQIIAVVLNKANDTCTIYRNGTAVTLSASGFQAFTHTFGGDTIELFHFATSSYFVAKIGRFIAYTAAHSASTVRDTSDALNDYWGIY